MNSFDDIVIGSGVSGLTHALILGKCNRKVLVLEKHSKPGGALRPFNHKNHKWDIGFHFTGGLNKNELMYDIIKMLGIDKEILKANYNINKEIYFEDLKSSFLIKTKQQKYYESLMEYFPKEKQSILKYKEMCDDIIFTKSISRITDIIQPSILQKFENDDHNTLSQILNNLFDDDILKGIISGDCLCYGVSPEKISFSNHVRLTYHLNNSLSRLKNGGEDLYQAIINQISKYDIQILPNITDLQFNDLEKKKANSLIANNKEYKFKNCIITINPRKIPDLFPPKSFSKAFINRTSYFEETFGFFSCYGLINKKQDNPNLNLRYIAKNPFITKLMDGNYASDGGICFLEHPSNSDSYIHYSVLETMNRVVTKKWENSFINKRTQSYISFKQNHAKQLLTRLENAIPSYTNKLNNLFSATPLTYRDYLHNCCGEAYGIQQKSDQLNLIGRLKYRNVLVAGQSALLPGILGSMLSSFFIANHILEADEINKLLKDI